MLRIASINLLIALWLFVIISSLIACVDNYDHRPISDAGEDRTIENEDEAIVTLSGVASSDARAKLIYYRWRIIESPEGAEIEFSDFSAMTTMVRLDIPGTYIFGLIVYDKYASSTMDTVTIQYLLDKVPVHDDVILEQITDQHLSFSEIKCDGCHEEYDAHASLAKGACSVCHSPDTWSPVVKVSHEYLRANCIDCHFFPEEHPETSNACENCHFFGDWSEINTDFSNNE